MRLALVPSIGILLSVLTISTVRVAMAQQLEDPSLHDQAANNVVDNASKLDQLQDLHAAQPPLMIEAPLNDDTVHKLDISSGHASIELGPVVVNEDGTLSRISNWNNMTKPEQDNTLRVLKIRNAKRLKNLQELEAAQAGTEAEAEAAGQLKSSSNVEDGTRTGAQEETKVNAKDEL